MEMLNWKMFLIIWAFLFTSRWPLLITLLPWDEAARSSDKGVWGRVIDIPKY